MRPILSARKAGAAAIALLAVAYRSHPGDRLEPTAHYALVRALADGTPRIDRTRHEVGYSGTGDVSKIDGHYYAAKSPGLAFETFVPYIVSKAAGGASPSVSQPASSGISASGARCCPR